MARNTTRQGANFELDVMHHLDGCQTWSKKRCENPQHRSYAGYGYDSLRSSGSRGAVDVVSVPEMGVLDGTLILFIQCKITNPVIPPSERIAVQNLALRAGALPLVAFKAKDETTGRIGIKYRQLTGPGPKDWAPWAPGEDN